VRGPRNSSAFGLFIEKTVSIGEIDGGKSSKSPVNEDEEYEKIE
jgi:hypothetical protein